MCATRCFVEDQSREIVELVKAFKEAGYVCVVSQEKLQEIFYTQINASSDDDKKRLAHDLLISVGNKFKGVLITFLTPEEEA
jgi:hypothetical protein